MNASRKVSKAISKTSQKSVSISTLQEKLKKCDPKIRYYIRALESENKKLHLEIADLQAKNVSLNNRINALNKQLEGKGPSLSDYIKMAHNISPSRKKKSRRQKAANQGR